ncbi:CG2 omega domain protein [Vibrio astriarenae]|uniref:CG2 omega domain protein n=1 Tax=Vibrio astriarenae TaxID=1481923 RepID=UPI0037351D9F
MRTVLLMSAFLFPILASADVTISGDKMELSKDCLRLEGDNVKITSEECKSSKNKHDKDGDNRSVHSDDNPGKGHGKKKDKD